MGRKKEKSTLRRRLVQVFVSSGVTALIVGALYFGTKGRDIPVLSPSGAIAQQQLWLILFTAALGLAVAIPVFILLFSIAYRYRATNKKATYEPSMKDNTLLEIVWWGIPCLIILALAIITWISTHTLDPYRELESDVTPVKVQVVALNHNWLFLYPDLNVATLNTMTIPQKTPINFTITADAPMNSFWIPALGGQVYAMSGMSMKLHLIAGKAGVYNGQAANINGESYATMRFKVYAVPEGSFQQWSEKTAQSKNTLTTSSYKDLMNLKERSAEQYFVLGNKGLYDEIVMKYMKPSQDSIMPEHGDTSAESNAIKEPAHGDATMHHMNKGDH